MSDYPPAPLGTSYTNDTLTRDIHPPAHNLEGAATNSIVEVLGDTPQGTYTNVQDYLNAIQQGQADLWERNLYGYLQKLVDRYDGRCAIMAGPGDSRTEGSGLTTILERWLNLLAVQLDSENPTPAASFTQGYIPSYYGASGITQQPVKTGNAVNQVGAGLGNRCTSLRATSGSGDGKVTWTVEGDHAYLHYARINQCGKSEYNIDSSGWVEVDHNNGAPGFDFEEYRILVDLVTDGTHTIEWRFKSAGAGLIPNPVVEGIDAFVGDGTSGVTVYDCSHSGFTTGGYTSTTVLLPQWISLNEINICLIDLNVNNWQLSTSGTIDADLATYKSELTTIIEGLVDGNADLEIVLMGGWTPRATLGTGDVSQYHLFVNVGYELAAEIPNVSVYDFLRYLPQPSAPGEDLLFYDLFAIHPTAQGHAAIGSAMGDLMSLPSGGAWAASPDPEWHFVGDVNEPAFENSWGNLGSGNPELCFRLVDGQVYLRGFIFGGALGDPIFTLPPAYRPTNQAFAFAAAGGGTATFLQATIGTDGVVTPVDPGGTAPVLVFIPGTSHYLLDAPPLAGS